MRRVITLNPDRVGRSRPVIIDQQHVRNELALGIFDSLNWGKKKLKTRI